MKWTTKRSSRIHGRRQPRSFRPRIEALEERILLSITSPPNQILPAAVMPLDVHLGRISSTSFTDLAALGADGRVTVALGNGTNVWRSAQTYDLGIGPADGMALTRLGSDPFLDLVVQGPNSLTLARGDGTGHFHVTQTISPGAPGTLAPTGGGHVALAAGLLSNHPFTDLVTVAPGSNEVLVFPGNAGGTLGPPDRYPSGASQPDVVVIGDFVGDSLPDLAVGHLDGTVTVFQGVPGGHFSPRPDLTVRGLGLVVGLTTGNFDGTGLALAVSSTTGVTLLKNIHNLTALTNPIADGNFSSGLTGWKVGSGSVIASGGFAQLRENLSGLTSTLQQTFVVPPRPQSLSFDLDSLGLDDPAGGIPDAFEASLLDGQQHSLVLTFRQQATTFFNANPGGVINKASGVTFDGRHVTVDISNLTPGSQATLVFDLVGNPPGTTSVAAVGNVQVNQAAISEAFTSLALSGPFGSTAGIAAGDVPQGHRGRQRSAAGVHEHSTDDRHARPGVPLSGHGHRPGRRSVDVRPGQRTGGHGGGADGRVGGLGSRRRPAGKSVRHLAGPGRPGRQRAANLPGDRW